MKVLNNTSECTGKHRYDLVFCRSCHKKIGLSELERTKKKASKVLDRQINKLITCMRSNLSLPVAAHQSKIDMDAAHYILSTHSEGKKYLKPRS